MQLDNVTISCLNEAKVTGPVAGAPPVTDNNTADVTVLEPRSEIIPTMNE